MKLNVFIPYAADGNLAAEYNRYMEMIGEDDYAVLMDHDCMFTTPDWYQRILDIIGSNPATGCFVAVTNRIGGSRQLAGPYRQPGDDNIEVHRKVGADLWNVYGSILEDFTKPDPHHMSGVMMVVSKRAWANVGGFKHWNEKNKILGVDTRFHQDLYESGEIVTIMKGLYVYHWYRGGDKTKTDHLT